MVHLVILRASTVEMAVPPFREKDLPLLQLQKANCSRVGGRVVSPIISSPVEASQPVCIPSPYTDLDFTTIPFYSPTLFGYAGPGISDHSSVHQSLSPSVFWQSHGHVGPHIPLHPSQPQPQHGRPIQNAWVELSPLDSALTTRCGAA